MERNVPATPKLWTVVVSTSLASLAGVTVMAIVASISSAAPAVPRVKVVQDLHDRSGDGGFLDIREARRGRVSRDSAPPGRPVYEVATYRDWTPSDLGRCADIGFRFPDRNRFVRVHLSNDRLVALMKNYSNGRLIGHPNVWRTSRRNVLVSIPKAWFGPGGLPSRWAAYSGSPPARHCSASASAGIGIELDLAPNHGYAHTRP